LTAQQEDDQSSRASTIHSNTRLDRAVWTAYGWEDDEPGAVAEDEILARLLALNVERAKPA
jgi:hypothetical protein